MRTVLIVLTMVCGVGVIAGIILMIAAGTGMSQEKSVVPGLVVTIVSLLPGLLFAHIATRL